MKGRVGAKYNLTLDFRVIWIHCIILTEHLQSKIQFVNFITNSIYEMLNILNAAECLTKFLPLFSLQQDKYREK